MFMFTRAQYRLTITISNIMLLTRARLGKTYATGHLSHAAGYDAGACRNGSGPMPHANKPSRVLFLSLVEFRGFYGVVVEGLGFRCFSLALSLDLRPLSFGDSLTLQLDLPEH